MTTIDARRAGGLDLLLRLDARRLTDPLRHPRAAAWAGVAIPVALALGGLWLAGDAARPDAATGDGAILLGLLVSAPVSLQAYPILFRPADDAFLRRLGIPATAAFGERALRLLVLALAIVMALMIPFVSTRRDVAGPLVIALAAAVASTAASLLAQGQAAASIAASRRMAVRRTMAYDPALAANAALVFAPLWPLIAGALAARIAFEPVSATALRLLAVAAASAAIVVPARAAFARALPRFAPHAGELAYAPPPDASGGELVIGRGLARMLPVRAQAVRARDAVVVSRRYRWASRMGWTVAIVAAAALLRGGSHPAVRAWATLACGMVMAAQAAAVVALGRSERGRTRWMDRALGLRPADRLVGRWATAFGLALAVALPLWAGWWIGVGDGGWLWLAAAAAVAVAASGASVMAAGR